MVKKRNLPPLAPAEQNRELTLLKRKELLREYTRRLDDPHGQPRAAKPTRHAAEADSPHRTTANDSDSDSDRQLDDAHNAKQADTDDDEAQREDTEQGDQDEDDDEEGAIELQ